MVSSSGTLTYLHADRLGSIIATTNAAGAVTNTNKYSPFGENAPAGSTFGFAGQRFDSDTGLLYFKYRFYNPAIGRFLQPDRLGYVDGLNFFTYVNNDRAPRTQEVILVS
jgi:RHS repeat-associated protein